MNLSSSDDALPYEQCGLAAMVNTSNADGLITDGFGPVRIRSLEGRAFAIEITEELSGLTITAVIDYARPARARVDLQRDDLIAAIERASKEQGMPAPLVGPH